MNTTYRFSLIQITVLYLTLLGNVLTSQSQNIAPPGIVSNQNKHNAPTLLSPNNYTSNSPNNTNDPLIKQQ